MTKSRDLSSVIRDLITDRSAAGVRFQTRFSSPLPTVTPPAGTLRADDRDVRGEFPMPDGRQAVTVDSWGSQASRMEAAAESIADEVGYPLIRFVDDEGALLTTSARLSHRHADASWRAARHELEAAEIPFQNIQDATVDNAGPLLQWYPIAVLFGWWHSHTAPTEQKKIKEKRTERLKALGNDEELADAFAGYARMHADTRSARVVTSEIVATGVARRLRMAAKHDSLFGPLKGGERGASGKSVGPSAVGLGSLPPVQESRAPVDVTFDQIHGHWFLSLAGLRRFRFGDTDPDLAKTLLVALALLLRAEARLETRLRAGTELIATADGSRAEVLRHGADAQPFPDVGVNELRALVKDLGAQVGWDGPREVRIPSGSILDRLLHKAEAEKDD